MSDVKVGLIGSGARLRNVVSNVLKNGDGIQIKSIFDPWTKSLEETQKILPSPCEVRGSYQELVADPEIDWVMIGSSNCFHREHTIAAFEAGKHVFCEKPLATTIEDCISMRDAWKKSGKKFIIGFVLRYSAHYEKLKELLDNGEIGYVVSMEFNETLNFNHGGFIHGNWRRLTEYAGTHLLEKCSHDIDLVNWLIGSRAKRVACFGGVNFFVPENIGQIKRIGKNSDGKDAFQTWRDIDENPFTGNKDVLDNQVAIIEYENNVRTTFHTNCVAGIPERRMYILGSEGTIRADVIQGKFEMCKVGFDTEIIDINTGVKGGHGGADPELGVRLAKCFRNEMEPHTRMSDGLSSAITCFAIDDAQTSGQVVDLAPYWQKAGI